MDIQAYIAELDQNTEELLALAGQIESAAGTLGKDGSWSVMEVLEHLLITERVVYDTLLQGSGKRAGKEELKGSQYMERVLVGMRSRKVRSPASLEPAGLLVTQQEFCAGFAAARSRLRAGLLSGSVVVDDTVHGHPVLGDMTVSDWLHFLLSHVRRHMAQIREIGPPKT